nr:hypothetical protein [Tanacetum cinerariifolium]
MSTRSSTRNLFPPLDNPELTIRRRSRADPTLVNDFDLATKGNGDPPIPDLQTMEELCQLSLNGRGGPIASIAIQATNFGLKNDMIQQEIIALKAKMAEINKNLMKVTPSCETCGGPHSYNDCPATIGQIQNVYAAGAYNQSGNSYQPQVVTTTEFTNYMKENDAILKNMQTNMTSLTNSNLELKNMFGQFMKINTASSSGSGTLPSNTITNPKKDLNVLECETEVTKDIVPPTNNRSTKDVQPPVVQIKTPKPDSEPIIAPVIEPIVAPLRDMANDQKEKFFQIFKDLDFNISFADSLILMPKFGPTIKSLLTNKDKLYELARTPLNKHCSTVLLKKFPKKLEDPGKFLIPCDFSRMDECLAMADLGASINLTPLSVWNKLSLPELTPTLMTLELADRSISRLIGVAEDVFVKVGKFYFPADFVVADFDADPRVPLILGISFLKTRKALFDVYEGEFTLRVGKEAITFNIDQTSSFFDVIASGNPTSYYDLIISTSSSTLTPFGDSDFLLEEVDAFLALEDDPTSPEVNHSYYDMEGDILILEAFLNDDPSLPPPTQGKYLPQVRKELKIYEAKNDKSSIDEPPEVKLKDLPPHLEYAFLEGNDKLPVIIAKDLSVKEKAALIKVLKSHKQAVAWKLSDIKGINPKFFTHKILIEDDFEPTVQHQRRFNLKIHDVIKKEVLKLLDAELIYPISDSPWGDVYALTTEKSHFMVKEGIVLGHKISKNGIKVEKAKVDVIAKLHHPTTVKGKLKTRWSGPFTITQVFPYGTVELSQTDGPNFKVNGHRLKHYFGEDIPKMVVSDLQTFPKDQ